MYTEMTEMLTERARRALADAERQARSINDETLNVSHLLLAIAEDGSSMGGRCLHRMGVGYPALRAMVQNAVGRHHPAPERLPVSPLLPMVLERAHQRARDEGHTFTGTDHILAEVFADRSGGFPASVLRELCIDQSDFDAAWSAIND